jgi:hypothetical protein
VRKALVMICALMLLLAVPVSDAVAKDTSCTGALGPVTIYGNVSAGAGCDLSNTTVYGNVTVTPGGSLFVAPGSTTTINGNLTSTEATIIAIEAGTIGGNLEIDGTPAPFRETSRCSATRSPTDFR